MRKIKLRTFLVQMTTEKTIQVRAIDEEDALEKAEARLNKTSNKWTAERAWEEE